jgi:hypothetical protein
MTYSPGSIAAIVAAPPDVSEDIAPEEGEP